MKPATGWKRLRLLGNHPYDAAVLDITMPGMDGVSVIREARDQGCRATLLLSTARGEVGDKVAGLDAGADDYLVKPYSTEELLARLRAAERRAKPETPNLLRVADLEIDLLTRTARRGGEQIILTNREFALLETLANASPRPVSKGQPGRARVGSILRSRLQRGERLCELSAQENRSARDSNR